MYKYILVFISVFFSLLACNKEDQDTGDVIYPNLLLGTWIYTNIENETQIMHRSDSLLTNRYGFTVLPNGEFIERKNSGWCGTGGDYIFEDYQGEWRHPDLFLYQIKVDYCQGIVEYDMIIEYLHKDSLRFHYVFSSITP
ncbi:MAG: hypothetical protein R2750_13460 [Bacteroidales bacterium]